MKTGAIILAAGQASRFGAPKQLLEWDGATLLDRACDAALQWGCRPIVRVLGAHHQAILERSCPTGVDSIVHPDWEKGMGSSLAAGASALFEIDRSLEAVLILLADQPHVSLPLLRALAMAMRFAEAGIALCDYGEATGPPALFTSRYFGELRMLEGDQGAKAIATRHREDLVAVPVAEAWDIDTPEAWDRFIRSRATTRLPSDR